MAKAKLYKRYPASSLLIYNGSTVLHFLLGGIGIVIGYDFSGIAYAFGVLYFVLALAEMYVLMPLKVCPSCVYYRLDDSLCISGVNLLSRRIAKERDAAAFGDRAKGLLCPNNLYMAALAIPIVAMIPALVINFSFLLLAILLIVVGLLVFRFFVVFTKIACVHCYAKYKCPQAGQMGVRDM
jgi:hypothetical protein